LDNYHSKGRKLSNWIYASRLAAAREFAFMKILHEEGFPVPKPSESNRHCVVMELLDGLLLNHLHKDDVKDAHSLCDRLLQMVLTLANTFGLVHGDFNEFNIMILNESQDPVLIDFPQMVPVNHRFAQEYFDRDVNCLTEFFRKRFDITIDPQTVPNFADDVDVNGCKERVVNIEGFPDKSFPDGNTDDDDVSTVEDDEELQLEIPEEPIIIASSSSNIVVNEEHEDTDQDKFVESDSSEITSIRDTVSCFSLGSKSTIPPEDIKYRLRKEHSKTAAREKLKVASKSVKGEDSAVFRKRRQVRAEIREDMVAHSMGEL